MTLASQRVRFRSSRSSTSSRFRRRKKQRNGRIVGGVILAALVLGGGYWVVTRIGGGPRAAAADEPDRMEEPAAEAAFPETSAANPPRGPQPTEILMGQAADRRDAAAAPATRGPSQSATQSASPPPPTVTPPQTAPQTTPTPPAPSPEIEKTPERPADRPLGVVDTFLQRGRQDQQAGKLVQARQVLNAALLHREATPSQKALARALLTEINQTLVFSPTVYEGDPLAEKYRVQSGDSLSRIVPRQGLAIHFHFLVRINGLKDANSLQLNQPLKLIRGPFHAVVDKSDYRIDIYAGDPPSPGSTGNADGAEEGWLYIRSFNVGLGEGNGTPLGNFTIKNKEFNPAWRNPRTGEFYDRNDPNNPIGEHWLGLQGVDADSAGHHGYGLHGTTEPDSIGRDMSMGCVRMAADDIATVWEMLTENVSTVRIRP